MTTTAKPIPKITDFNRAYWEGTAAGELRLQRCQSCQTLFLFKHQLCPNCWADNMSWERMSGKGTISHFSVVHHAPYAAFEDVAPYVIILVQLEEGVRMMSNLIQCDPQEARVGAPVHVVFEPRGEIQLPMFVLDR